MSESSFFEWEEEPKFDEADRPTTVSWGTADRGDAYEGVVTRTSSVQQTDVATGEKLFHPVTGRPKMSLVVVIRVSEATRDDNGLRAVWINRPSYLFTATGDALKAAGKDEIEVGDFFRVQFTGYGEASINRKTGKKNKPPRLFKVTLTPGGEEGGEPASSDDVDEDAVLANLPEEARAAVSALAKKRAAAGK